MSNLVPTPARRGEPAGDALSVTTAPAGAREELVVVRCGVWRMALPMRHVVRIHEAALPSMVPAGAAPSPPVVSIEGALVPVAFGEALLGAEQVTLASEDKMVLLQDGTRSAVLWVSAVEEVVVGEAREARPPPAGGQDLVAGFSAPSSGTATPLAVLDVPRLIDSMLEGRA